MMQTQKWWLLLRLICLSHHTYNGQAQIHPSRRYTMISFCKRPPKLRISTRMVGHWPHTGGDANSQNTFSFQEMEGESCNIPGSYQLPRMVEYKVEFIFYNPRGSMLWEKNCSQCSGGTLLPAMSVQVVVSSELASPHLTLYLAAK